MSDLTKFFFKATLRKETPEKLITFLDDVINLSKMRSLDFYDLEHAFLSDSRTMTLFNNIYGGKKTSFYLNQQGLYILEINSLIKDVNCTISSFLSLIKDNVCLGHKERKYLGYQQYSEQINFYLNRNREIFF